MIEAQLRSRPGRPPSAEDAAADIRRLTAELQARRQAAPDNVVELAALAVDLQRASALWRRLAPQGVLDLTRSGLTAREVGSHPRGQGQRTSIVSDG